MWKPNKKLDGRFSFSLTTRVGSYASNHDYIDVKYQTWHVKITDFFQVNKEKRGNFKTMNFNSFCNEKNVQYRQPARIILNSDWDNITVIKIHRRVI